jgi:phosphoribosylformylglycinamidine synthase
VSPADRADFERVMGPGSHALVGTVTTADRLVVKGLNGVVIIDQSLADLKNAWQRPLKW